MLKFNHDARHENLHGEYFDLGYAGDGKVDLLQKVQLKECKTIKQCKGIQLFPVLLSTRTLIQ